MFTSMLLPMDGNLIVLAWSGSPLATACLLSYKSRLYIYLGGEISSLFRGMTKHLLPSGSIMAVLFTCKKLNVKYTIQCGSEYQTSLVLEWSDAKCMVFKSHLNTGQHSKLRRNRVLTRHSLTRQIAQC